MNLVRVTSDVIDALGYDEVASSLTVVFSDGRVYEFHLVPRSVYEEFLVAPSKGSFFNEKLKNGPYGSRRTRKA